MFDVFAYLELVAALLGVISVVLSAKANLWVFPTGMVSVLIYVYICYVFGLYADAGVNAYYFIMSVYGWYTWSAGSINQNLRPISRANSSERFVIGLSIVVVFLILYWLLISMSDSEVPTADALTTSFAVTAMWLMARKKIEHWVLWLLTDFISIGLYAYKGLYFTSMQYLVFSIIALYGYLDWKKKLTRRQDPT